MLARNLFGPIVLVCGAGLWQLGTARADAVLYDSANFVQGQQSFVESFTITDPGTLTVSLTDVPWLDAIQGLTCFLTSSTGIVGTAMGQGTESMHLDGGTYYMHWFGNANGKYNVGVDKLELDFHDDHTTAVPLPASLVLFLAGLGLLMGWQRPEKPDVAVA